MSLEDDIREVVEEVNDEMEHDEIEVNGLKTHSWEINANTSPTAIGEKVLMLTLTNPQQVFRLFRADDIIFITAVEGEQWERVGNPD